MTQAVLNEIKHKVIPILKEEGVAHSSLFGSYVRGEQNNDSDVDILVDFPKEKSLFDFIGLKLKLEDALHRKVDLGEFSTIKSRVRDRILKEQQVIL